MPAVTVDQLAALVENLTKAVADNRLTATAMDRHIATAGQKVGNKIGLQHAKAAREQIEAKDAELREMAFELQRANDLVAELRRQHAPLQRAADKANLIAHAVRKAHYAGEKTIAVEALLAIIKAPATPNDKENQP
jgi:hypothetical protein